MKKIEFVPSICSQPDAKWVGKITIKKFNFDERYEFLQGLDVSFDENGAVNLNGQNEQLTRVRKMVAMSEKFYLSVDIKNSDTGEELKSFEDISYCDELHNVLVEVASFMLTGQKVGNA